MGKSRTRCILFFGLITLFLPAAMEAQEKSAPQPQFPAENERCEKDLRILATDTSRAICVVVEADMAACAAHTICNRDLLKRCVILFSVDLIRAIEDQDVSALLAHEMGHVEDYYKNTEGAASARGVGFFEEIGDTPAIAYAMDVFAVTLLRKSSIPPEKLIALFRVFSRTYGSNRVAKQRIKKLEKYIRSTQS